MLGDNVLSINLYSILIKTANEIELQPISCPEIEILKSRSSFESVSLRFYLNSSSGLFKYGTDEIGVFWRDFEGKEILYHTIRTVGGGFDVSTYPGHPWVVRRINSNVPGECVMGFIIEGNDSYSDQVDFIAEINL